MERQRIKRETRRRRTPIFTRKMSMKLTVVFMLILLMLLGLMTRIFWINYTNGDAYTKQVLGNQTYTSKTIPCRRGDIVDRNGVVIATSIKVYNMILDPKVLNTKEEYIESAVSALVQCFGYDEVELRQIISEKSKSSYVKYKKQMEYEEIAEFVAMNVKGVWFEEEYVRKYPYNSLASSVIGFTLAGNVGNWGIEGYYNSMLNGVDGRKYGYVDEDNNMEPVIKDAVDGSTIVSTIDINIQMIVEKYIAQWKEEYTPKGINVIVADPKTNEILAMASDVYYDLNNPRDLSLYYTQEELDAMTDEETVAALNKMWRNKCISDTFEPGSTMKPFTVAAALEEALVSMNDEFDCNGYEKIGGWTIRCHRTWGHGKLTLSGIVGESCNDGLMAVANKMGVKILTDYQSRFGFGKYTGIDLPGEESCANLLYKPEDMDPATLATNSFGQNMNVTMVQLCSSFCSIINGGYYYEPHVVNKVINPSGGVSEIIDTTLVKRTVTEEVSAQMRQILLESVTEGIAKGAKIKGYDIAGKSGTAQKLPREDKKYIVSFIGYATDNEDEPALVCYVAVDEPITEGTQSSVPIKLFKTIMEEVLPYMNIFPKGDEPSTPSDKPENPDSGADNGDFDLPMIEEN